MLQEERQPRGYVHCTSRWAISNRCDDGHDGHQTDRSAWSAGLKQQLSFSPSPQPFSCGAATCAGDMAGTGRARCTSGAPSHIPLHKWEEEEEEDEDEVGWSETEELKLRAMEEVLVELKKEAEFWMGKLREATDGRKHLKLVKRRQVEAGQKANRRIVRCARWARFLQGRKDEDAQARLAGVMRGILDRETETLDIEAEWRDTLRPLAEGEQEEAELIVIVAEQREAVQEAEAAA